MSFALQRHASYAKLVIFIIVHQMHAKSKEMKINYHAMIIIATLVSRENKEGVNIVKKVIHLKKENALNYLNLIIISVPMGII